MCRLGPDVLAQVAIPALGGCNMDLCEALLEELQALVDEYSGAKVSFAALARACAILTHAVLSCCKAQGEQPVDSRLHNLSWLSHTP